MTSKYFKLEEFLTSSTARQKSLENLPSWEIVEHLGELALFLDDLREEWGSGIIVSSGFRNEKLNDYVGGVPSSAHKIGYAADIQPANGKFEEFVKFIKNWAIDKHYDQIIIESKGKTRWVHVGLYNAQHQQRRKLFNITVR
jgi:hypothetical protein